MRTLTRLGRHSADFFVDGLHRRALAYQGVPRRAALPQGDGLGHQPIALSRLVHQVEQVGHLKRLEQVIVGAEFGCLDGGLGCAEGRDQDDGQTRLAGVELAHQRQAVQSGQPQIGDDHIERLGAGPRQTLVAALLNGHDISFVGQTVAQGVPDARVIFDQQDFGGAAHLSVRGNTIPKVEPRFTWV